MQEPNFSFSEAPNLISLSKNTDYPIFTHTVYKELLTNILMLLI